jgi:hypothetical protein
MLALLVTSGFSCSVDLAGVCWVEFEIWTDVCLS